MRAKQFHFEMSQLGTSRAWRIPEPRFTNTQYSRRAVNFYSMISLPRSHTQCSTQVVERSCVMKTGVF